MKTFLCPYFPVICVNDNFGNDKLVVRKISNVFWSIIFRGVYSSIIPPPPQGGGKESKALRTREGNQRRVKKKGREKKGKEKGKGKGKEKGRKRRKKKRIRVREGKKYEGKGNEKNGQGDQCKRTEKLWNQSDNT